MLASAYLMLISLCVLYLGVSVLWPHSNSLYLALTYFRVTCCPPVILVAVIWFVPGDLLLFISHRSGSPDQYFYSTLSIMLVICFE